MLERTTGHTHKPGRAYHIVFHMSGGSPLLRNSGAAGATDGIAQVFIFYSAFPLPFLLLCLFVFVSVSCFFQR